MRKVLLVLILLTLLIPIYSLKADSSPRTIVVYKETLCMSGDMEFNSISEAVASALPSDTVVICPGSYNENVRVEVDNIVITGYGDPTEVEIVAFNSTQDVIELRNVRNVTLMNLTVRGGLGSQISGVRLMFASESTVKNIISTDNYYGLNVVSSSDIMVQDSTAENNTNAGINVEGTIISTFSNLTTRRNRVGIYILLSSELSVDGVTASENSEGGFLIKYSENNSLSSLKASGNGWYGVFLQDSDNNTIFNSVSSANVASGSDSYGIYLYQGSEGNRILNFNVSDDMYGIALVASSNNNLLDGFRVTNSTIAGIYIEKSVNNTVKNSTIRDSLYGIWIEDGQENLVVHSEIEGCGWGIYINGETGSNGNEVKGVSVHDNTYSGIVIDGNTINNTVTKISSFNNTLLGIDLGGDYVTPNDGSLTDGPNRYIDYPVIQWAAVYGSKLIVKGYINTEGSDQGDPDFDGAIIEIYLADNDESGYGEGYLYIGELTADGGEFLGWLDLPEDLAGRALNITATSTMEGVGTSEFGPRILAPNVNTNISVSKVVNPSSVFPDSNVEVTLLVRNYGNGTAYNVTVTDILPDGMEYQNGTSRVNGDLIEPTIEGNNLSWVIDVPEDSEVTIKFNATVTAPPGTTLENVAVFEGGNSSGNDTEEVNVLTPPTIVVTKTSSESVVDINGTVSYTVLFTNQGDISALALVEDKLPSGMVYVNGSLSSNVTVDDFQVAENVMSYNLLLPPKGSALVSYELLALTDGTKKNEVYVNGTFAASSSVIVRDPPSSDGSGSSSRRNRRSSGGTPPPCSWWWQFNNTKSEEETKQERHSYRLDKPPIVFVSLGSSLTSNPTIGDQSSSDVGLSGGGISEGKNGATGITGTTSSLGLPLIVVELIGTPTEAPTGSLITFVVKVNNIGDGDSENLSLLVDLSKGLDYISGSSKVGGVKSEPQRNENELRWNLGTLAPNRGVEISFKAKLLASSGEFNVVASAGSSSDSVSIRVKPKEPSSSPTPPPPPPAVADLKLTGKAVGTSAYLTVTVSSPTGAEMVNVIVNLPAALRYKPGTAKIGGISAKTEVSGNIVKWVVNIGKGKSLSINFEAQLVDEEATEVEVKAYLPEFGKSDSVTLTFEPKQRSYSPVITLPSIPWWAFVTAVPIVVVPLAWRRRKGKKIVVMDYMAIRSAVMRDVLEDILRENKVLISKKTFEKINRDKSLMAAVEGYLIDGSMSIRKSPKRRVIIQGADEELSSALGLADKVRAPIYIGNESLLKELRRLGFDARLVKDAPPPSSIRRDLP